MGCFAISASAGKKYSYFRVGNATDAATSTTPGTVLMGGGTDVDAAFVWMCGRSGNGDFLVMHIDYDLQLDTIHFGQQTVHWMQQPTYWVTGSGYLARAVNRLGWKVTAR
jgi:hypothetical protein